MVRSESFSGEFVEEASPRISAQSSTTDRRRCQPDSRQLAGHQAAAKSSLERKSAPLGTSDQGLPEATQPWRLGWAEHWVVKEEEDAQSLVLVQSIKTVDLAALA